MKRLKIRLRIISSVLQDVITGRSKCGLFVSSVIFEQFVSSICGGGSLTTTINTLGSIGFGPFSHGFELLVLSGFSGKGVGCVVVKMSASPHTYKCGTNESQSTSHSRETDFYWIKISYIPSLKKIRG